MDVARLERALVVMAYVVVRHGPTYAPILRRLERELEAVNLNEDVARARRILAAYSRNDGPAGYLSRLASKAGNETPE